MDPSCYKSWRVTGYFPFCAALFTAGFAARIYGAFNYDDIPSYIASTILIYASPYVSPPRVSNKCTANQALTTPFRPVLELANYHILGRIMYYVPYCAPLHPGRVLTTFGSLSFLVEVLNAVGIAWLARPDVDETITRVGDILTKASLILQLCVISLFCVLAALFQRRCSRAGVGSRPAVLKPLVTLYVSMALIFIRSIYRVVEHFGSSVLHRTNSGLDPMEISPIIRYEWFFYVFEATLMIINSYLWNGLHPMRSLPSNYHVYLSKDGHTEVEGQGWKDTRPFILTWIDPFGLMIQGNDEKVPFRECQESGSGRKSTNSV